MSGRDLSTWAGASKAFMDMADGLGDEVRRIALRVVTTDLGGEEVTAEAMCGGLMGLPTVIHRGESEGMPVISGRGVEPALGRLATTSTGKASA